MEMNNVSSAFSGWILISVLCGTVSEHGVIPDEKLSDITTDQTVLCSQVLCQEKKKGNCTDAFNACICTQDFKEEDIELNITCPHFSGRVEVSETYAFINCYEVRQVPDLLLQPVFKFAHQLHIEFLDIRNCCLEHQLSLSVVNTSKLVNQQRLTSFYLENSCIQRIVGQFTPEFINLEKLSLSGNQLSQVDEGTFYQLANLISLDLSNNRLSNVTRRLFSGLPLLSRLHLNGNQIEILPGDIFDELPNLKVLDVSNNFLKLLPENLFRPRGTPLPLNYIFLQGNNLSSLPESVFFSLSMVYSLDLSNNKLEKIPEKLFKDLESIAYLMLGHNQLTTLPNNVFENNEELVKLNLTCNKLFSIPLLQDVPDSKIDKPANDIIIITSDTGPLRDGEVIMSDNCITSITDKIYKFFRVHAFKCQNCCLTSNYSSILLGVFGYADLQYNNITRIDMRFLKDVVELEELDLRNNLIRTINLSWEYPIISLPQSLPFINIRVGNNPILCDCHLLPFLKFVIDKSSLPPSVIRSRIVFNIDNLTCDEPLELKGLSMFQVLSEFSDKLVCNVTDSCPPKCYCFFIGARDVTVVDCSKKSIKEFPTHFCYSNTILKLNNNDIQQLPIRVSKFWHTLTELYLENNTLVSLNNLNISNKLEILHLHNNNLSFLNRSMVALFRSNLSVTLAGNPWECNCNLHEVKKLIASARNVLDYHQMTCTLPKSKRLIKVADANDYELCPELMPSQLLFKVVLPLLASVVVLTSILITIGYRYNAEIKLWLFVHGCCLQLVTEDDLDAEKQFDAFISYSTEDEEWVARNLVEPLENGVPKYTLLLHSREWPVGEYITDMIFRSVKYSRRTIIVLTENFAKSHWSRLEFEAAYQNAINDQINRVLIVVPQDLPDVRTLGSELQAFITLNTYIRWDDPYFWRKLRCAMPRVRKNASECRRQVGHSNTALFLSNFD